MSLADELFSIFRGRGAAAYFGERVSVTEHSLQTAFFARECAAAPALIVAALLHDLGHLLETLPDFADWKRDARHEEVGAAWLARYLPPEICEPVRLHVPAKRYLCAVDRNYVARLSPASAATLGLQGGPMSAAEALLFEKQARFREALQIRQWDDQGKVAGLRTPGLEDYRDLIEGFAPAETGA